jgi:hypothetical protein
VTDCFDDDVRTAIVCCGEDMRFRIRVQVDLFCAMFFRGLKSGGIRVDGIKILCSQRSGNDCRKESDLI